MSGHTSRKHAKYSGSTIHRSRYCPGWARLAAALARDKTDNEAAVEGTTVHELLEMALLKGLEFVRSDGRWTKEREEAYIVAYNYVEDLKDAYPDLQVFVERRVFFPQNVVERDEAAGLADIICYSPALSRGWVIDYKNGCSWVPDPQKNDQLWFYGTAAFWETPVESITFVIIQPNWYGEAVRESTAPAWELVRFQTEIEAAIARCEALDAPLMPGDWCGYCVNATECTAYERSVVAALTGQEGTIRMLAVEAFPKAAEIDVNRWAEIKSKASFIRKWLTEVDKAAYSYVMSGGRVPGMKLVEAEPMRKWVGNPRETATGLAKITGLQPDDFLKTVVVGITEAETVVRKAIKQAPNPDDLRKDFALLSLKQSSGALSLVPEDDKRPEYNRAAATFSGVKPVELIDTNE